MIDRRLSARLCVDVLFLIKWQYRKTISQYNTRARKSRKEELGSESRASSESHVVHP